MNDYPQFIFDKLSSSVLSDDIDAKVKIAVSNDKGAFYYSLDWENKIQTISKKAADQTNKDLILLDSSENGSYGLVLKKDRKNELIYYDFQLNYGRYTLKNLEPILNAKLNVDKMIVYATENELCVPSTSYFSILGCDKIIKGKINAKALALSSKHIAYCEKVMPGTIHLLPIENVDIKEKRSIVAFGEELALLEFSPSGDCIAAVSVNGTLIKLFSTATLEKLHEFRRGIIGAVIHSLSFDYSGRFVCVVSDTQTAHIFSTATNLVRPVSYWHYFGRKALSTFNMFYNNDVIEEDVDFAWCHLPSLPGKKIALVDTRCRTPRVFVMGNMEALYIFKFDDVKGGECKLIKKVPYPNK